MSYKMFFFLKYGTLTICLEQLEKSVNLLAGRETLENWLNVRENLAGIL